MFTSQISPPNRIFLFLLCAIATFSPALSTSVHVNVADTYERASPGGAWILETLWAGNEAERREAAEEADDLCDLLEAEDETPLAAEAARAIRTLRGILRLERDDWIASRILQNLYLCDSDRLDPIFVEALRDSSPNRRWRAIQWFTTSDHPDALPLLERLWKSEKRPWVRADLIEALTENGAEGHTGEFLDLAAGPDPRLAEAAIEALTGASDPNVITSFARIAGNERIPGRSAAIDALASWPNSPVALESLLQLTRAREIEVRLRAIQALGAFSDESATRRIEAIAERDGGIPVRRQAIEILAASGRREVLPILTSTLREFPDGDPEGLRDVVLRELWNLDDPSVLPDLKSLDARIGSEWNNVGKLIEYLSRDRTSGTRRTEIVSLHCGLGGEDGSEVFRVAPSPPLRSIRCWRFPNVAGDPEDFPRVAAGGWVEVEDHFEGSDDSWVMFEHPEDVEDCWVPSRSLNPIPQDEAAAAESENEGQESSPLEGEASSVRREFDLSLAELRSARALEDAGLLKVIDPAEEVVGVALDAKDIDEERLLVLIRSYRFDGSILDAEIEEVLDTLHPKFPDNRELNLLLQTAGGRR